MIYWWFVAALSHHKIMIFLYDAGVAGIYGPGTNIPDAAAKILNLIIENSDV